MKFYDAVNSFYDSVTDINFFRAVGTTYEVTVLERDLIFEKMAKLFGNREISLSDVNEWNDLLTTRLLRLEFAFYVAYGFDKSGRFDDILNNLIVTDDTRDTVQTTDTSNNVTNVGQSIDNNVGNTVTVEDPLETSTSGMVLIGTETTTTSANRDSSIAAAVDSTDISGDRTPAGNITENTPTSIAKTVNAAARAPEAAIGLPNDENGIPEFLGVADGDGSQYLISGANTQWQKGMATEQKVTPIAPTGTDIQTNNIGERSQSDTESSTITVERSAPSGEQIVAVGQRRVETDMIQNNTSDMNNTIDSRGDSSSDTNTVGNVKVRTNLTAQQLRDALLLLPLVEAYQILRSGLNSFVASSWGDTF